MFLASAPRGGRAAAAAGGLVRRCVARAGRARSPSAGRASRPATWAISARPRRSGRLGYHEGELRVDRARAGPAAAAPGRRRPAASTPAGSPTIASPSRAARRGSGWRWGSRGRLRLRYRAERRWLGATGASTDLLHAIEARVPWQAEPLVRDGPARLAGAGPAQRLGAGAPPSAGCAAAWRRSCWPDRCRCDGRRLGGHARAGHRRARPTPAAALEARVTLGRHLQLFASFDLSAPTSAGATRDYARRVLTVGTAVSAAGGHRAAGAAGRARAATARGGGSGALPPAGRRRRLRWRWWAPGTTGGPRAGPARHPRARPARGLGRSAGGQPPLPLRGRWPGRSARRKRRATPPTASAARTAWWTCRRRVPRRPEVARSGRAPLYPARRLGRILIGAQ